MRMSEVVMLCVLFVPNAFIGCRSVDKSDVPGDYAIRFECGIEILQLHSNGTYKQFILLDTSSTFLTHIGSWEYDDQEKVIDLIGGLRMVDGHGYMNPDILQPIERLSIGFLATRRGSLVIVNNEDLDLRWQKLR